MEEKRSEVEEGWRDGGEEGQGWRDGGAQVASWDTKSQSLEERHHTWRCGTVHLLLLPSVSQAKRGNRTSHIVQFCFERLMCGCVGLVAKLMGRRRESSRLKHLMYALLYVVLSYGT